MIKIKYPDENSMEIWEHIVKIIADINNNNELKFLGIHRHKNRDLRVLSIYQGDCEGYDDDYKDYILDAWILNLTDEGKKKYLELITPYHSSYKPDKENYGVNMGLSSNHKYCIEEIANLEAKRLHIFTYEYIQEQNKIILDEIKKLKESVIREEKYKQERINFVEHEIKELKEKYTKKIGDN